MTSLLDLPAEIILSVIEHLSREQARGLRLVSKHLERAYFDDFARNHFRKRGFMITTDSLNVLQHISQHAAISRHVQHIWFNPDCFTFADCPCKLTDGASPGSHQHGRLPVCAAFASHKADHWSLMHGDELSSKLAGILRSLPMLKTIGMRRGEDHRPYGWRSINKLTGLDPRVLGDVLPRFFAAPVEASCLFVAILIALHESQVKLQRLYTDAIQLEHPSLELPTEAVIRSALSSVRYLEINVIGVPADVDGFTMMIDAQACGSRLETVLGAMNGLHEIGVTIFRDHKQRHMVAPTANDPSSWRDTYPFLTLQRVSDHVHFTELRRVKLEKVTTTASTLTGLLRHSAAMLMSLKIRHVQLLSELGESRGTAWGTVYDFLYEHCKQLEYILLYSLSSDGLSVRFTKDVNTPLATNGDPSLEAVAHLRDHASLGVFTDYETINLELLGKKLIHDRLEALRKEHWSGRRLFSYSMDDAIWFTDTSDEDW